MIKDCDFEDSKISIINGEIKDNNNNRINI